MDQKDYREKYPMLEENDQEKREREKKEKKKKKKEKKSKKEKKDKKKKEKEQSSSESEKQEEPKFEWVEKSKESEEKNIPDSSRESWMLAPPTRDISAHKSTPEPEEKKIIEHIELKPGLNKGGDQANLPSKYTVGDGGAGWRRKALQRAKETTKEGENEDSILKERSEALEQLESRKSTEGKKEKRRSNFGGSRDYLKKDEDLLMKTPKSSSSRPSLEGSMQSPSAEKFASIVPVLAPSPKTDGNDANKIAAAMLKAKLKGDKELEETLKKELEQARKEINTVSVDMFDSEGKPIVSFASLDPQLPTTKRGKFEAYEKGERARYYRDDDVSLEALVAKEKLKADDGFDTNYAKYISKRSAWKNQGTDEMDDNLDPEMWESSSKKKKHKQGKQNQNPELMKAIQANSKMSKILDACWFCFSSPNVDRNCVISIANTTYLAIPKRGALTEGHCMIIPMQHHASLTSCDESVWDEIKSFQSSLTKMFRAKGKHPIFFEIATELKKQRHTFLEVVPLPLALASQASIYFKKGLLEAESDWQTHKKIHDVTPDRPLKKTIPPNFPYFYVDFGFGKGFAHVVDDEKKFSRYFAREILAGMLQLDHETWMRPKDDSPEVLRKKVASFVVDWDAYDWTMDLIDEGEGNPEEKKEES